MLCAPYRPRRGESGGPQVPRYMDPRFLARRAYTRTSTCRPSGIGAADIGRPRASCEVFMQSHSDHGMFHQSHSDHGMFHQSHSDHEMFHQSRLSHAVHELKSFWGWRRVLRYCNPTTQSKWSINFSGDGNIFNQYWRARHIQTNSLRNTMFPKTLLTFVFFGGALSIPYLPEKRGDGYAGCSSLVSQPCNPELEHACCTDSNSYITCIDHIPTVDDKAFGYFSQVICAQPGTCAPDNGFCGHY